MGKQLCTARTLRSRRFSANGQAGNPPTAQGRATCLPPRTLAIYSVRGAHGNEAMMVSEHQPTREELERALEAARAKLESLRDRSADVSGTGNVIEGAVADGPAPAGSAELLEEIAELERALGEGP